MNHHNPQVRKDTMIDLAMAMADYLTDQEAEDYWEQCAENERDCHEIDVANLWHIYQTVIYFQYLAGYKIDERYKFKGAV